MDRKKRRGARLRVAVARLPRALTGWLRLGARERWVAVRAVVALVIVESAIRWIPLPRLARALGVTLDRAEPGLPASTSVAPPADQSPVWRLADAVDDLDPSVRRNAEVVASIMGYWPFGSGPCLRESLVLGHLVRRFDPVLRFGVAKRGTKVRAHAWVEVAGVPLSDPGAYVPFDAEAVTP